MIRSAWVKTTSMSCSVKRTAISRFVHDLRGELHQLHAFPGRHARRRLVHEQEPGFVRQRDRKLDPLEVAIGQHPAGPVVLPVHADAFQQRHRLVDVAVLRRPPQCPRLTMVADQYHLHIFAHGHRREGRGDLESPPDAEPPDGPGRQAQNASTVEPNRAGIGPELAVHHVEAGRLAGAIGSDQGQEFARRERERDPLHRPHTAERLAQRFDLQHRNALGLCRAHGATSSGCASRSRRPSRVPAKPTIPWGSSSTRAMMVTPSRNRQ